MIVKLCTEIRNLDREYKEIGRKRNEIERRQAEILQKLDKKLNQVQEAVNRLQCGDFQPENSEEIKKLTANSTIEKVAAAMLSVPHSMPQLSEKTIEKYIAHIRGTKLSKESISISNKAFERKFDAEFSGLKPYTKAAKQTAFRNIFKFAFAISLIPALPFGKRRRNKQ